MAESSSIEWTDATWNPVTGCSVVSPGCTNCYAMKLAGGRLQHHPSRAGLTTPSKAGPVWNGQVRLNESMLTDPLRWTRPRRIFVCAHGDLFHEAVPDEWIDRVFAVMAIARRHTFQVLTKRPDRMRRYLAASGVKDSIVAALEPFEQLTGNRPKRATQADISGWDAYAMRFNLEHGYAQWPLPNVWLGTSAEDQVRTNERIPELLASPAAVRFVSLEPLLGPIDLTRISTMRFPGAEQLNALTAELADLFGEPVGRVPDALNWVIAGGESGPGARPMHPDWARQIRDDCEASGVAFHFKQWGAWREATEGDTYTTASGRAGKPPALIVDPTDGPVHCFVSDQLSRQARVMLEVGKKAAGRLLDGVEHNGMPA